MTEETAEKPAGAGWQTQAYLMNLLTANGLRPNRDLGQNFLIDLNLMRVLEEAAALSKDDIILEVGTGTGALTNRLAHGARHVVTVEKDRGFYRLAQAENSTVGNITFLQTDALATKSQIAPIVLETLRSTLAETNATQYKLVANLPYDIATPLISNLIIEDMPLRSIVVTIQLEFAERLLAQPGTKDYGPITVLCQTIGTTELVRKLPPTAFWPRPKVTSAIVRINVKPESQWLCPRPELAGFNQFVRELMTYRRKNLRANLLVLESLRKERVLVDQILEKTGRLPTDRAENLDPNQLLALYRACEELRIQSTT